MRPYFAIIVDSFREALASRVLWLLLLLITLVLLAIVPFSVEYPITTTFHRDDVDKVQMLSRRLVAGGRETDGTPRRVLWDRLSDKLRDDLEKAAITTNLERGTLRSVTGDLTDEFNDLIESPQLFSAEALGQIDFRKEGRQLRNRQTELSEIEAQRLNRLAIANLFRRDLSAGPSESVQIHYLGLEVGGRLPMNREALQDQVKFIVAAAMNFIGATFGVFAAILVTASIIPNMFDAGSVNLLFSKPIMRPLLYLAKFIGGCWFVFINAVYLIAGIYLVVGWRFAVWNPRVLYVIPILMFLFAVYYSVSAFAGVVWRNTIISVIAPIVLWAACFGIGMSHDFMEALGNQPRRVIKVIPAGDDLLTVAESGAMSVWDAESSRWASAFEMKGSQSVPAFAQQNRLLGPVYDSSKKQIVAIDRQFSQSKLYTGTKANEWQRESVDAAPTGGIELLHQPTGDLFLVEREGISRVVPAADNQSLPINIFGLKYNVGPKRGSFQPAGPRSYDHAAKTSSAAMNPDDGSIIIYGEGVLHRLTVTDDDDRYQVAKDVEVLKTDKETLLAATGNMILLADEDGVVQFLDSETLLPTAEFTPFDHVKPRFAASAAGGRFVAVLFHNKRLWVYDLAENREVSSRITGQGDLTALAFGPSNELFVADRVDRVRKVQLPNGELLATESPLPSNFDKLFRWLVQPLYLVFPKPSKLKETSLYLLTEQDTIANTENRSLQGSRVQLDPWTPVWNSAFFTLAMLALACVYIQRQEF